MPSGAYSFDEAEFSIASGDSRRFWANFSYRFGDLFDGQRERIGAGIGWRLSDHFLSALSYDTNDVELPGGDFITRLVQLETEFIFSATFHGVR